MKKRSKYSLEETAYRYNAGKLRDVVSGNLLLPSIPGGMKKANSVPISYGYSPRKEKYAFWPHLRTEKRLQEVSSLKNADGSFKYPEMVKYLTALRDKQLAIKTSFLEKEKENASSHKGDVPELPQASAIDNNAPGASDK